MAICEGVTGVSGVVIDASSVVIDASSRIDPSRIDASRLDPSRLDPSKLDQVFRIVRRCAERKVALFSAFPDISADDLMQIGVTEVLDNLWRYNPATAAFSTFAYMIATRRFIDLHRRRLAQVRRESQMLEERQTVGEAAAFDDAPQLAAESTIDWLGSVYQAARRQLHQQEFSALRLLGQSSSPGHCAPPGHARRSRHRRRGRPGLNLPQRIALCALRERLKLSERGAVMMLDSRPELLRALELRRTPSARTIGLTAESAQKIRLRLLRITAQTARDVLNAGGGSDGQTRLSPQNLGEVRVVAMGRSREWDWTPGQMSTALGVSEDTLARWRKTRKYLEFWQLGRIVRYRSGDAQKLLTSSVVAVVGAAAVEQPAA